MAFNLSGLLKGLPVVGGAFDDSEDKAVNSILQNQSLYGQLQTPDTSWQNYTPEAYGSAGNYDPTLAQATTIQEDPSQKSAQLSALQKMAGLADSGLSDQDKLGLFNARNMANQQAQQSALAAEDSAQARGVGGGGLEFALREQGAQGAADRAQQGAMQQAAQTAQQRALYNQAYLSGLGDVRNQDFRGQAANADILNRFNQANTQTQNQAQQGNLQNKQALMTMNTGQNNAAQQYNQAGRTKAAQQNFENQYKKTAGQAGANTATADTYGQVNAGAQSDRNANTDLLFKGMQAFGG